MSPDALKVSVVVATYCPGKGLDRLIRSLDAQTLPQGEWEAVFVDDGSPDDTVHRLKELARTRPHMRVERIENSGWPCRPRNVGTDMARGEYIAYMDHDDELFPDALRAAYDFASTHALDVLNGKEARTHDPGWGIDQFRADAVGLEDAPFFPLSPTNPHKLYRRAFLNEHDIRFREGGRVLWEDIFFNILAVKHGARVGTMASTPYYHWFTTKGSGSTTFRRSRIEWWAWLDRVIDAIDTDLAGDGLERPRTLLRRHQYRSRLMDSFNNLFQRRPPQERDAIFARAKALQDKYFTADDDVALTKSLQMRAQLLRAGDQRTLETLMVEDPNIPAVPTAGAVRWVDGTLQVDVAATWVDSTGRRFAYQARDGRVTKTLPPKYDGVFRPELLDVTEDIRSATVEVGMRSRRSRVTWMAPTRCEGWWKDGSPCEFGATATAEITPATAAMGAPLERGEWELNARCTLGGVTQHRILAGKVSAAVMFDASGSAAAYTRSDGKVVLDFDQSRTPLTHFVTPTGVVRRVDGHTHIGVTGLRTDGVEWSGATKLTVNTEPTGKRLLRVPGRALRKLRRQGPGDRGWHRVPAELVISGGTCEIVFPTANDDAILVRLGQYSRGKDAAVLLPRGHDKVRPVATAAARLLS